MARAIPPLPDQGVVEFQDSPEDQGGIPTMNPTWREFWVKLLGAVGDLNVLKTTFVLPNFANDAAAAAGGISIGQMYRNGSVVQIRVT